MIDDRATDGRKPGRRGQATRQRLLECTTTMLERGGYRELKIVDIAREAGTSPATFYQYFPDVEGAIAVLAQEMAESGAKRLPTIVREQDWSETTAFAATQTVVQDFFAFWDEHRPLMRVIDLTSAEGNEQIRPMRMTLMSQFAQALADVVGDSVKQGRQPASVDPLAVASVVVTLLVNVAIQRYQFEFYKISRTDIDASVVRMVHGALTGLSSPDDHS